MCFAPQRRALFRHLNFQKWSDAEVFCTFWLGSVLRATTACNFSSLIWPAWLRTRRFSEPTFRPSGAPNHWKNTVFRGFPTFSRICVFFLLIFSLLTLFTSAFQLSILSEVSLLNFLRSWDEQHPQFWSPGGSSQNISCLIRRCCLTPLAKYLLLYHMVLFFRHWSFAASSFHMAQCTPSNYNPWDDPPRVIHKRTALPRAEKHHSRNLARPRHGFVNGCAVIPQMSMSIFNGKTFMNHWIVGCSILRQTHIW